MMSVSMEHPCLNIVSWIMVNTVSVAMWLIDSVRSHGEINLHVMFSDDCCVWLTVSLLSLWRVNTIMQTYKVCVIGCTNWVLWASFVTGELNKYLRVLDAKC